MKPDTNKLTYSLLNPPKKDAPKIIFGSTAIKFINALVDLHSLEVGFYAIVDDRGDYTYFIRDVFYPKHSEAHGASCEISPEGESDMMNWLMEHGRESDIEKVKFWGHSHHNMDTGPSQQDEKMALERMQSTGNILIRAICNKKGQMSVSFFDPHQQIIFDHIKWTVEDDTPENINQEKLDAINVIIASESSIDKKIKEIQKIANDDTQVNAIRTKIIALKEINIPYNQYGNVNNGFYANKYSYNKKQAQINLFQKKKKIVDPWDVENIIPNPLITTHHQDDEEEFVYNEEDELEQGYQRNLFDKTNDNVDDMLNEWEKGMEY